MKLRQLPSGRWLVRVSFMEDGRQKEISKTFTKRREAESWQRRHELSKEDGVFRRPSKITVGAYLDRWLRDLTGPGGRTREDYENISRRYLIPALGGQRLDKLTPPMVREMLAVLSSPAAKGGRGLAPRTVAYARAVLRRALNTAVADGLLLSNPASGRDLVPKQVRREMQVLSGPEVNRLLAETRDDPHHALWTVLLTVGLRLSEALALRWTDLDLDRAELRVSRKLRRPKNGAAWLVEDCKTDKSRRSVPLLVRTVQALQIHRDRQGAERLALADGYRDHNFVFANDRGEPLRGDGLYKYHWLPALTRLKLLRIRLHDARHSAATMLLEAGVPLKVVQEMLGHSSITVTGDLYSHVRPAFARQAADALAAHLEGAG
jgi:integrase